MSVIKEEVYTCCPLEAGGTACHAGPHEKNQDCLGGRQTEGKT